VTGLATRSHQDRVQWLSLYAGARGVVNRWTVFFVVCSATAIVVSAGCTSHPRAVKPPKYDAKDFADALLERCDANGDGSLSKQEAEQAPGLLSGWPKYDSDGDGAISRDELQRRVDQWAERGDGLIPITCDVRLGGRRIGNVQVKLAPDEALEGVIQPAMTVSDARQATFLVVPPELKLEEHRKLTGMQYGLYFV
jgi:hypothetical protein